MAGQTGAAASNFFEVARGQSVAAHPYILEPRADAEPGSLAPLVDPTDYRAD